ncbi:AAA family ATPase [Bradyrhizobium diazoefficiens]|nr:AAA family ATPase [Bradyrhizobium diazoefficiens]MBR0778543.1 AAA family ATPase [Bradyrhizobium diazoefficiens]
MTPLEPDRDQLEIFVDCLFRHCGHDGYVSLRSFTHNDKPLKGALITVRLHYEGHRGIVEKAVDSARRAANEPEPCVFCPPIAVFKGAPETGNKGWQAREIDLYLGLAISVECDNHPDEAMAKLEEILGEATAVVRSGGQWINGGEPEDKLHLHWRLKVPASGDALARLKEARRLATKIVGGDATNIPAVHCLRWPGSWHRKASPRLCEMVRHNADVEIDLDEALDALRAAAPPEILEPPLGGSSAAGCEEWSSLVGNIIAGREGEVHRSITVLAAKMIASGMGGGAVVNHLRGLMDASSMPRDERWRARYDYVERGVREAEQKFRRKPGYDMSNQEAFSEIRREREENAPLILSSAEFTANFVPPDYVVVGILQRRFIYALTGRSGSGKTATLLRVAAHVALRQPLLDREVEQGRVLYLAGENPDDVRMRWIALAQQMGFEHDAIDVHFIDSAFKISAMIDGVRKEIERIGPVSLIIVDTSTAFFEGDDENNNVQAMAHAQMLRGFLSMPGGPCVLVACHPTKAADDANLMPRGGGAFFNEIDGGLTQHAVGGGTELRRHPEKFRGPHFEPLSFRLRAVTHERLKDSKGRLIPTVIAEPLSDTAKEDIAKAVAIHENDLLVLLLDDSVINLSQTSIAKRLRWMTSGAKPEPHHARVRRVLAKLEKSKMVTTTRGIRLTPKGKAEAERIKKMMQVGSRPEADEDE